MKYFSIPADFKKETIDKFKQLNDSYKDAMIHETYGNITLKNDLGSGRSVELLPEIDLVDLKEYVQYSQSKGIDFNYTINASHLQNKEFTNKGCLEIIHFLGKLYNIGVRSLTISLPSLMEIIHSSGYDFKIKASVICQVTTPNKARLLRKSGVDKIVVDESLNRDFFKLKQIVDAFGKNSEVIINSICHKDCTSRMFHYNQISSDSIKLAGETSANYYTHRCLLRRFEHISNLMKLTWIRPEDLHYYTSTGINHFKLQGRHTVVNGDPARTVECYFKESFDGDLLELIDMFNPTTNFRVAIDNKKLDGFIKPFYQIENFCWDNCESCGYCETFARKSIDENQLKEIYQGALEFFSQYDKFNQTLSYITKGAVSVESKAADGLEADFDLA